MADMDGSEQYKDPQNPPPGTWDGQQAMTEALPPLSEVPLAASPRPSEFSPEPAPFPIDPVLLEEDASRFAFPLPASPMPADSAIASPARPKKQSAESLDEEEEQTETSPATSGPSHKKPCLQAVGQHHGESEYAGGYNGTVETTQPLHPAHAVSHHDEPLSNADMRVHSANESSIDQQAEEQVQSTLLSHSPQAAAGPSSQVVAENVTSEGEEELRAPHLSTSQGLPLDDVQNNASDAGPPLGPPPVMISQQALLPTPVGVLDPRLVPTNDSQQASVITQQASGDSPKPKAKSRQPAAGPSTKPALKSKRRIKTSEVPANARPPMGVDITLKEICVFAPKWIIHPGVATRLQRNGVKIAMVAAAQVDAIGRAGEPALLKTVKNRLKKEYNQGGKLYTGSTHWYIDQAVALGADDDLIADQWKFRDFYKHRNKETMKAPTEEWEDVPLTTFLENIPEGKWPTGQDRGFLTRMLEQVQEDKLTDLTTAHWNLVAAMLEDEPPRQSKIAGKNLDEEAVQAFHKKQ
ncbi:hypothetical protein CKM354_000023800 [Cercospora kikuchii]|uniref:Uncharacterized protein n=1 Tax=Cercospora kikuchii TaxID=84275 RepID=A0A9P3C8M5_9PEZI|nr:uncharacterized protein CKM354_000023800 [Cercospora kikuchii]GIZ36771.1 hypothetical protein CKM354_000023800 [Cercospora kikuchii]